MSQKVIIFGVLDTAQLANYYLETDSDYDVVAFTVHKKYLPSPAVFENKPVVAFEELETAFPSREFKLFVPMTGAGMNKKREAVYLQGKAKGYTYISYISSRVSRFNNKIGENCFILEDNTLQPFTDIGDNVVMWSGNHIGHHGQIKSHVFFTSHVVLSGHCVVEPYSWFGVNSTIRDYSHITEGTLIAMGACLTKQKTDPWSVYMGVPAKKLEGKTSIETNP
jgi:acetyltransferase-like isoleucine patch superfamily enzyme